MGTVRYTTVNGEIIAEKRAGVRRLYVPDPLGSTVALLDNTQAQTDTFSYWPYGQETSRTGTTPTPFRFVGTQGYYRDSASRGYVRNRFLSLAVGRWFSPDPLYDHHVGAYNYVKGNPLSLVDRSGTSPTQPNLQLFWACFYRSCEVNP
jgi:RHS repeat-associated protein